MENLQGLEWLSLCNGGGCPEVAELPDGGIALRDSREPEAAVVYSAGDRVILGDAFRSGQI